MMSGNEYTLNCPGASRQAGRSLVNQVRQLHFCWGFVIAVLLSLIWAVPCWAALISQQQEIQIGKQSSQKLEKQYGLVKDEKLVGRINQLGQKICAGGTRGLTYHFAVLNSDAINALAFPGGFVYVTKGITKVMSEDELSFVMGHEIGHVECRHSVKQLERTYMAQAGGSLLLGLLNNGKSSLTRTANKLLVNGANTVISNRYSQDAEREADKTGMYLMAKAGYDPMFAIDALEVLKKYDGKGMSGFMNSLLSTHPMTSERIKNAQDLAPQIPFDRSQADDEDEDEY